MIPNTYFLNPQWEERKLNRFLFCKLKGFHDENLNYMLSRLYSFEIKVNNKLDELYKNGTSDFYDIFNKDILEGFHAKFTKVNLRDYIENILEPSALSVKVVGIEHLKTIGASFRGNYTKLYSIILHKKKYKDYYYDEVCSLTKYLFGHDMKSYHKMFKGEIALDDNDIEIWDADNKCLSIKNISCDNHKSEIILENNLLQSSTDELINLKYINKNRKAPIFIVNSAILAHKLQKNQLKDFRGERIDKILDFLEEQSAFMEKAKTDERTTALIEARNPTYDVTLNRIKKFAYLLEGTSKYSKKTKRITELKSPYLSSIADANNGSINDPYFKDKISDLSHITHYPLSLDKLTGKYDNECDIVWSSVFGGVNNYEEESIKELLKPLTGRSAYWVLYQDTTEEVFLKEFVEAYRYLQHINLRNIKFIHISIQDRNNRQNMKFAMFNPEKLLLDAYEKIREEIPDELQAELSKVLLKHKKRRNTEEYILYPAIRKNAIVLLTAKTGHGKSYFSMLLSYAIARKTNLFSDWIVKNPAKVLYILDIEVDEIELKKRQKVLEHICKSRKNSKSVYFKNVCNMELLKDKDKAFVEREIINTQLAFSPEGEMPQLLVLDCLTKLTSNGTSKNGWQKIHHWLDYLMKKFNITILLVHHQNLEGHTYGTSFIENAVNSHIHIEKQSRNQCLALNIAMPKNRHGATIQPENSIKIRMYMGRERPRLTCPSDENNSYGPWKSLKPENKIKLFVNYFSDEKIKGTMEGFSRYVQMSKPTIEKFAQDYSLTKKRWKKYIDMDAYKIKSLLEPDVEHDRDVAEFDD